MAQAASSTLAALCLAFVAGIALAQEAEDDEGDPVAEAIEAPIECGQPASLAPLFDIAASGSVGSADDLEALAQANEAALLKCPRTYLLALKEQSRETQDEILGYFDPRRATAEFGKELRSLKNDPQVGPLVRTRFAAFLGAR